MNILNLHPVDELAAIRAEIKQLDAREAELRSLLLDADDHGREGALNRAAVQHSTRETLDKAALVAALGRDVVAPYLKTTAVKTLRIFPKEQDPI